jgi:hypothetical protein
VGLCPKTPLRGRRPLKPLYLKDALQGTSLAGFGASPHACLLPTALKHRRAALRHARRAWPRPGFGDGLPPPSLPSICVWNSVFRRSGFSLLYRRAEKGPLAPTSLRREASLYYLGPARSMIWQGFFYSGFWPPTQADPFCPPGRRGLTAPNAGLRRSAPAPAPICGLVCALHRPLRRRRLGCSPPPAASQRLHRRV